MYWRAYYHQMAAVAAAGTFICQIEMPQANRGDADEARWNSMTINMATRPVPKDKERARCMKRPHSLMTTRESYVQAAYAIQNLWVVERGNGYVKHQIRLT